MLTVANLETACGFTDVGFLARFAIIFVDAFALQRVRFCLIFGAKDVLEFLAGSDVRIASCFLKGAFELIGYASWDERDFGVRTKMDAVIVAVGDVGDVFEDLLSFFSMSP